ncbi:flavoprotein [Micromonospora aurantiaca (nom. illeg.)]|uniref:flavoprotein n=1 Tax=Micromonospora aurantiaca (nom. illeg.) TaxID=47850 RepID=UPI0036C8010D
MTGLREPDIDVSQPLRPPRLLIGACGAASVVMLPSYLAALRARLKCHTTVVLTAAATRFLPSHTVGLFADEVIDSTDPHAPFRSNHVTLATTHDLVLVIPATANLLAEVVHGHAPSLLTAIVLAAPTPVFLVPSMNRSMWLKPAVQRNIRQSRADGIKVIEPQWREGFEVSTKRMVENPSMPAPTDLAETIAVQLDVLGDHPDSALRQRAERAAT